MRVLRQKARGQALVLVAFTLTLLIMLALVFVEIAGRAYQRAQVEDALKQASRSAVQVFDYAAFSRNGQQVRETHATRAVGCSGITPDSARFYACQTVLTNLAGVSGLRETPAQTAARITWTFLPHGGTCTAPGRPPVTFTTPAVCATLRPQLAGLIRRGVWSPQIDAADTLDHLE